MEKRVLIATFNFEVNAIFARKALFDLGISSDIKEKDKNGQRTIQIWVDEDIAHRAKLEIDRLKLDESPIDADSEGYVEGLREWSDNTYNAGHYTGGKIPRYDLDKSNYRVYGIIFLLIGILILYSIFRESSFNILGAEYFLFGGLYIIVAISLLIQFKKRKKQNGDKV